MNFSIKEISTINEYNKLRFILNVFENLRYELLSEDNNVSLDEFEKLNVVYNLLEKLYDEEKFSERDSTKNESSILFLNRKDVLFYLNESNFVKDTFQNKIEKKLLEKLEKELKTIINNKKQLIETMQSGKIHLKSDIEKELDSMYNNYHLIYKLLNEVFDLMNDIFEYQKIQLVDKEKAKIEELIHYHSQNMKTFESIKLNILNEIFTDQNIMSFNHICMNEDKRLSELDALILKQKEEIIQYENLGKSEIRELAIEYRKLCNLIECKKENL